jgi:hypothetical protein
MICTFVPDGEHGIIMYELAVFQAGTSVLIDYSIGHGGFVNGVLRSYMTSMGVVERDGAENALCVILNAVFRILMCSVPSGVPQEGGGLHVFFLKGVNEIFTGHTLRSIDRIWRFRVQYEGGHSVLWECRIDPRR